MHRAGQLAGEAVVVVVVVAVGIGPCFGRRCSAVACIAGTAEVRSGDQGQHCIF